MPFAKNDVGISLRDAIDRRLRQPLENLPIGDRAAKDNHLSHDSAVINATVADRGPVLGLDAGGAHPVFCQNAFLLSGWAVAACGIAAVEVHVAEQELEACYGLPAPDQADNWPEFPDADHSRFRLEVDASGWRRGEHRFRVMAKDTKGAATSLEGIADVQPFEQPPTDEAEIVAAVNGGGSAMWCEVPDLAGGKVTEEHPEIRGWAIAPEGIDRVLVTVDRNLRLRATHNLARPDLRWVFGEKTAGSCGFVLRLDPAELPPGCHELAVVAVTKGSRAIGCSGKIQRIEYEPPLPTPSEALDTGMLESAERFSRRLHQGTPAEPEQHARYEWAASLIAGDEILDAGCGVGCGAAGLAARAGRVVGVDLALPAITEARRDYGARAEFRVGDLLALPFEEGRFDVITCFETIEHVADTDRALDELHRVLRPGGLLLISSANRGVYPPGNPLHLRELTAEELRAGLGERFANVGIYRQDTYLASLLGTDAALELDDPDAALDARVSKLLGGRPGKELYTVAAATDRNLPPPPNQLVLGGRLDHTEDARLIQMWQERAVRAEVDAAATRSESFYVTHAQQETIDRAAAREDAYEDRIAAMEVELAKRTRELESTREESLRHSALQRLTEPLRALRRTLTRSGG